MTFTSWRKQGSLLPYLHTLALHQVHLVSLLSSKGRPLNNHWNRLGAWKARLFWNKIQQNLVLGRKYGFVSTKAREFQVQDPQSSCRNTHVFQVRMVFWKIKVSSNKNNLFQIDPTILISSSWSSWCSMKAWILASDMSPMVEGIHRLDSRSLMVYGRRSFLKR